MTSHTFRFRLHDLLDALPEDAPALRVERLSDSGAWDLQEPGLTTPAFRLYLIALLLCLRYHLVHGASAHGLPVQELRGAMDATVADDWTLEEVQASFQLRLDAAAGADAREKASEEALAAIRARMAGCPVVRNLPGHTTWGIRLGVEEAGASPDLRP